MLSSCLLDKAHELICVLTRIDRSQCVEFAHDCLFSHSAQNLALCVVTDQASIAQLRWFARKKTGRSLIQDSDLFSRRAIEIAPDGRKRYCHSSSAALTAAQKASAVAPSRMRWS